jgi:hypothetical protein
LANIYKAKEYVLANGASRHEAGALHIQTRLGKGLCRTTMRTLSLSSRNIQGEYVAQFTRGSIAIKIVKWM